MALSQSPIETLSRSLQIPLTEVVRNGNSQVVLYYNKKEIGKLPVFINNNIVTYGDTKEETRNLKWLPIFLEYKDEFKRKISGLLNLEDIEIAQGMFKEIYVQDSEGKTFTVFEVSFANGIWNYNKVRDI